MTCFLGVGIAKVAHATCGAKPIILIVQDQSGSMEDPPDDSIASDCSDGCYFDAQDNFCAPDCPSKWQIAASAVPAVITNFSSDFQYAYMPFAGDSDCGAGTVTLPVGATPTQIQSAYSNTAPESGTPTGETLAAALTYLQGLNNNPQYASVPKYVLLITDGMPDCNSGGPQNTPDSYAEAEASALHNAGFSVFVVGFGTATAGNDKATLDAIASNGGTNSSYSAMDQSTLETALDAIVGQVVCCTNNCTLGAVQCDANGNIQTCATQTSGCTDWNTSPCRGGEVCQNGSCQPVCTNACTLGAAQCDGNGGVQTCVTGSSGCTVWQDDSCGGAGCNNGACCPCVPGAQQCDANGDLETCEFPRGTGATCPNWVIQPCTGGACLNDACFTSCVPNTELDPCGGDGASCTDINGGTYCATQAPDGGLIPGSTGGSGSDGTSADSSGTTSTTDGTTGTTSTTSDNSSAGNGSGTTTDGSNAGNTTGTNAATTATSDGNSGTNGTSGTDGTNANGNNGAGTNGASTGTNDSGSGTNGTNGNGNGNGNGTGSGNGNGGNGSGTAGAAGGNTSGTTATTVNVTGSGNNGGSTGNSLTGNKSGSVKSGGCSSASGNGSVWALLLAAAALIRARRRD
jgi:uncharacterized protein (TIGR03382 family)